MSQWDEEVDLICVGSGISGCAAAIAAAAAGLRVMVLEKSHKLGGTTIWSLGIVWVGNGHIAVMTKYLAKSGNITALAARSKP